MIGVDNKDVQNRQHSQKHNFVCFVLFIVYLFICFLFILFVWLIFFTTIIDEIKMIKCKFPGRLEDLKCTPTICQTGLVVKVRGPGGAQPPAPICAPCNSMSPPDWIYKVILCLNNAKLGYDRGQTEPGLEWIWGLIQPGFVRWAPTPLHKTTLTTGNTVSRCGFIGLLRDDVNGTALCTTTKHRSGAPRNAFRSRRNS